MADVTPLRQNIALPEAQFRAAVSESTIQKIGGSINFINEYQQEHKSWWVNGAYGTLSIPFSAIDGLYILDRRLEVVAASMFIRQAGTSGSTTLDVKYATAPGGAWTSIFSTLPSIQYLAGNFAWCYTGSSFTYTTAPVVSVTTLEAGWALRLDITAAQGGDARGTGLNLNFRPIS